MEENSFKKKLQESKFNSEKIMIIFQYPTGKPLIRKGTVLNVDSNSFDFNDRYDGVMTFSYNFICEISKWEEG